MLEQQGVIRAALKRIYPGLQVEHCAEHQASLERFLEELRRERESPSGKGEEGGGGGGGGGEEEEKQEAHPNK